MQIGDLVKFDYINGHTGDINDKVGIYLGPKPIVRGDGKTINNFAIQFVGCSTLTICDEGLMRWLTKV